MYTDDEKRIGIPIKTFILSLILIVIFILLLMWLLPIPSKSNNNSNNNNNSCSNGEVNCPDIPSGVTSRVFVDNVKDMKEAAISYFTTDKLPGSVGSSVKLTLQEMIDKHLILSVLDKDGNSCNTKDSYVILTKQKDSYELKVNLKCGNDEGYILVPLGCYSYCTTGVCENKDKKQPVVPTPTPKPDPKPKTSAPSCSLTVSGKTGDNGWYVGDATVTFKSKTTTNGAKITAYGIGTDSNKNFNGIDKYVVNNDGTITVYGYVKDSYGYTATCSTKIKRDTVKPSCSLSVLSGTKAANGNYVTDVVLGFASKIDATSGIAKFGMSNSSKATYNDQAKYTIKTDGTHKIYGFVMDNAGNAAACNLTVKRETPVKPVSTPKCTLKVTSGTKGSNGWYVGNVSVGFDTKTTTNGATIKSFGLGTSETYSGNTSYTVSKDGTTTVYGYVKDSNGYTASCSIEVKRDTTKPSCSLKVTSGKKHTNGFYTSDIVIGFASKTDATSKIASYGIGLSETYSGNTSYTVKNIGTYKVMGYVKDKAGNTATCSITVEKRDGLEYQYKKDIAAKYSAWTDWQTLTYNPSSPPSFGNYALIQLVDLGKTREVDYYLETLGNAIYKNETIVVGTIKQKYCTGYDYYRETATNTTYAVKVGEKWEADGVVSTTGTPTDSLKYRYEFVGLKWDCSGCETIPRKLWNRYKRTTYVASSTDTVTTTSNVVVKCSATETKDVELIDTVKIFVDYERFKTPVYKDVYRYKRRTRTETQSAYTDYKWSFKNDTKLLNDGYVLTGKTREI